jgi:hypothetical protein
MKHSKYHIELHYSVKQNDLSIFRTDSFFTSPTSVNDKEWERKEREKTVRYLSRFMRKSGSDGDIIIKEISPDGFDENGMERLKYIPVKLFQVKNDAVVVKTWWSEKERYFDGTAMGAERAIKELTETLEI